MKITLAEAKRRLIDSGFQILAEPKIQDGVRLECDGGVKVVVYDTGTCVVAGKPGDLRSHAEKVLKADSGRVSLWADSPSESEILGMAAALRSRADLFEEALSVISRGEVENPVHYAQFVLQKARTINASTGLQGEQVDA